MTDHAFAAAFRDTSLPTATFHHRDHVRMAWIYVREFGAADAPARFAADLQQYARAKGVPGLFHATITTAYLALVAERVAETPDLSWDAFAAAHPDLLTWKPGILDRFYSADRLWSPLARVQFVMPDLTAPDAGAPR